jgi:hypothetical protein
MTKRIREKELLTNQSKVYPYTKDLPFDLNKTDSADLVLGNTLGLKQTNKKEENFSSFFVCLLDLNVLRIKNNLLNKNIY